MGADRDKGRTYQAWPHCIKPRPGHMMTALSYFAVIGIVMLILFITKDPMQGK
jgi:hypothetical protein